MPAPKRQKPDFTVGDEGQSGSTSTSPRRDPNLRLPKFTSMPSGAEDGNVEEEEEEVWHPSTGSQTPTFSESAQHLRRSLSVHGLHELATMPPSELRKSVGKKIWRPHDEEVRMPNDWERLAVHVFRGGVRGFNMAFMLRGSVMIVFALIRAIRSQKLKGKAIVLAMFGADNIRFSLMFAAWTTLYKTTSNSLRLMTPIPESTKTRLARAKSNPEGASDTEANTQAGIASGDESVDLRQASGTTTPSSNWRELEGKEGAERAMVKSKQRRRTFMRDPRSKVWHAYVAGAISALAIMIDKKDNRVSLAQQLLVRGLEGTYNTAHSKGLVNIPNGAVISFGLACGQIMYAWLNQPHTLPRSYISWITQASHISPAALPIHRDIMHNNRSEAAKALGHFTDGKVPSPLLSTSSSSMMRYPNVAPNKANRRGVTGKNVQGIIDFMKGQEVGKRVSHVPCEVVHPWENSHLWSPVDRFVEVVRWIMPVYMTLHFVPAVFLRMRSFKKDPARVFLRSLFGSIRSSSFLGLFVIIFQTTFCTLHQLHDKIVSSPTLSAHTPTWLRKFLVSTMAHWGAGFLTSLSLFVEHKRRRTELAMYVLPKGMESAWSVARQRSWLPFVPGGDLLLTSAGMSLIMGTYAQNPDHLSGVVRRIVYQFVGRN
ncbi:hypothetical protein CBS101457_000938 [Exobasidium rhododendri]|nr:hypothetical protein CBS101457_000938 [Exobasidium rhododendri]